MSDESGRSLIDEDGRLFGLVNVIDALVVLLFLAVLVAGVVLLFPSGGGEPDTRYATIELGQQPEFVAEQITAGDEWDPEGTGDSVTVTDVYRFGTDGGTGVTVRAGVNGTVVDPDEADEDPVFEFLGEPLRLGRTLEIQTTSYELQGNVTRVDPSGGELPVRDAEFVVETTLDPSTVEETDVGDEFRVAGAQYAEITSFEVFPAGEDQRYALIGISGQAIERSGALQFANRPVRVGATVPFETGEYEIAGSVLRRGTGLLETERRPFVIQTTVPTAVADDIERGDEFTVGNTSVVSVEGVTVYATNSAEQRRVVLGASALTLSEGNTVLFGERELQIGSSLPVRTGEYSIAGEIVRRDSLDEPGTPVARTVRLQLDNVRPERAEVISEGLTERVRETTTARILDKSEEPAVVILTSESGDIFQREHPRNVDIELRVELAVRELEDGSVRFRGQQLRTGEPVALELGALTIQGELIEFED